MAKAVTRQEKRAASQLAKSQETSRNILAQELRADGVPSAEIKRILATEEVADQAEVAAYRQEIKAPGVQQYSGFQQRNLTPEEILAASPGARGRGLTAEDVQRLIDTGAVEQATASTGYIAPDLTTVNPQYAAAVERAVQRQAAGIEQLQDLGIQQNFKQGKTSVGTNALTAEVLSRSVDPATGQFTITPELRSLFESPRSAPKITNFFNAAQGVAGRDDLTAEEIGGRLKGIKGTDDLFTATLAKGPKGDFTGTFVRNDDGTYEYVGGAGTSTPTGGGGFLSGFLKSAALGIVGSFVGLPSLGTLVGASGAGAAAINLGTALASGAFSQYKSQAEYEAAVARGEVAGLDSLFTNYFQQLDAAEQAGPGVTQAADQQAATEREQTLAGLRAQGESALAEMQARMASQQQAGAEQSAEIERLRAENQAAAERNRLQLEGSQRDFAARRASRRRAVGRGRGGLLSGFSLQQRSLGNTSAATSLGTAGATTLAGA